MKRTLLCVAAALAFAVCLPANRIRAEAQGAEAQESADAGGEASSASGQSADASADTSGSADAQSSNAQTDSGASASSDTSGTAQSSSSDAASNNNQQPQSNNQSSQSSSPSLPAPSEQTDAQADANADANATRNQNQDQAQPRQNRSANNRDANQANASARGRADAQVDASHQGRDRADSDRNRDRSQEIRRGIRFGRATNRGLTINFIQRNSIFFDSGLRQGDMIVSLRGRPIRSEADFIRWVAFHPGDRVPVIVLRDGRQETIYITYPHEVDQAYDAQAGGQAYLGVGFDAQVRNAAVVRTITPGSPAEQAGLQPGDEIVALNNQEVGSHQDAIAIIRSMQPGDRLNIAFARRMENETEAILAGRPGQALRTATYEPEVRVEQRVAPAPEPNDRPVDANRDRARDRQEEKPLLQRLLD